MAPANWDTKYIRIEEITVNPAMPAMLAAPSPYCSIKIIVVMLVNSIEMLKVTEEVNREGSRLAMAALLNRPVKCSFALSLISENVL